MGILSFLDNASVAAFVGSASAFLLVIAVDAYRRSRKKRLLIHLVADNQDLARNKLQTVKTNIAMMREDNSFTDAPIMAFPVQALKHYHLEVLDKLNANENVGLNALLYWMEAIDGLLDEVRQKQTGLMVAIKAGAGTTDRNARGVEIIQALQDAERNLEYLITLCGHYVDREPEKIQEFQHPVGVSRRDT